MKSSPRTNKRNRGFTLLELLLVIVVIGYLVSLVRLPALEKDPFEKTEEQAQVIRTLINLASEYSVLNQVQMGFAINKTSFAFLAFDGTKWQRIEEPPFMLRELEPDLLLELTLDGLAWSEENLISAVEMIDEQTLEEQSQNLSEEEKLLAFPQIFILSSGEVSPFDLRVVYDNGFDDTVEFLIRGEFIAPVAMYDPQQQLELDI